MKDPLAVIVGNLRSAVIADASLLLKDLYLGVLGYPNVSMAERFKRRSEQWGHRASDGSHLELIKRIFWKKSNAHHWVVAQGVRTPLLYWTGTSGNPPDFASLPKRFVLKPEISHSCRGAVLYDSGTDLMSGQQMRLSDLGDHMRACEAQFGLQNDGMWMVEEFVRDVDSKYAIPRDFKLTSAGGRSHLLYVADRNDDHDRWTSSWYARPWVRISDRMNTALQLGPDHRQPDNLEALFSISDGLAAKLGVFVRIDWYLTPDGPVFGEFTPFPNHGLANTMVGERALTQLWSLFPDIPMEQPVAPGWRVNQAG